MSVADPSVDEFAAGAAEWLAAHRSEAPPDYGAICPPEHAEAGRRWQRLLFDAGLRRHPLAGRARRSGPHARSTRRRG